ncbi:MAG: hypothetical protein CMC05_11960 [Flavobacteriaceae bacterium]|uniref:hypothetical protein n=1 Tax=Winogradskyella poriferorum TaxID=307627 RepID=UPI000C8B7EE2|nr:hypothetical protein [Flavobacteriaceae bacterium]|tara:strand:+ start:4051 stop:4782 length:732 start_codon:yes stop_codon:yes gene_type:complete
MIEELRKLYLRFNYTNEKGFIFNAPTSNKGEHISISFDNKRKEFNVHFTDDSIKEAGAKRRTFFFVISAFRFFLFLRRFETLYTQGIINLVFSSKINLGKLKKHKFIINTFFTSDEAEDKLITKKKNGKYWKFKTDIDLDSIIENYKYIEASDLIGNSFNYAYKFKNNSLLLQGIIFNFENLNGIYFIPIKKWNRFMRHMAIAMYNHFNTYPTEETLPLRQLMYERLKHPYINPENKNSKKIK